MRVYSLICFKIRIKKYPYLDIAAVRAEVTVRVLFLVICDVCYVSVTGLLLLQLLLLVIAHVFVKFIYVSFISSWNIFMLLPINSY
jgi:hypothetical protein